jgi:phenylalanyl-tRNA synthetase beta chain
MSEALRYSFLSSEEAHFFMPKTLLSLINPLNPDEAVLRPSLLPGLLSATALGRKLRVQTALFEVGQVFWRGKNAPEEQTNIACVLAFENTQPFDFQDLKKEGETLFGEFRVGERTYRPLTDQALFLVGQSAEVMVKGKSIARIGMLSRAGRLAYDLSQDRVGMIEIYSESLYEVSEQEFSFRPVSRFPSATRDISLSVPDTVTAAEVEEIFVTHGQPLLESYILFDIFEQNERKRFGYHLSFADPSRTIESAEMDTVFDAIVTEAATRFGGYL